MKISRQLVPGDRVLISHDMYNWLNMDINPLTPRVKPWVIHNFRTFD